MNTFRKLASHSFLCAALAGLFGGCVYYGKDSDRTTGRVIDDRNVTSRVTSVLDESPVYKFPNVRVSTYNGVVQLSGFVIKDEQKIEAAELARRVPGVTEVINNISLAPMGATGAPAVSPVRGPSRNARTNVPPGS